MELNKIVPKVIIKPIDDWTNIYQIVINLIYYFGEYMDNAIICLGLLSLRNNCLIIIIIYLIGVGLCVTLNYILKKIIRLPRPCINQQLFDILLKNDVEFVSCNEKKYHIYGMPSGHSQLCGYTLVFISMFLKNHLVTGLYLFVTLLTMYQRVIYDHQSILQVIIGVVIGCVIGLGIYNLTKNHIKGNLTAKEDDLYYLNYKPCSNIF